ncbi:MAG TPA: ABC transporter permease [Candidatus Coproplasma stercoripullorum]|uniref:ABC transporter permease n=1 Tax=Candidatus Coproplasma stercoripullorum TaxID=2840751 RepID=A0A9D1AHV2_9FIRM|nr:ABC transporter permease [Candidatus Coproplasma stercoripullorum]
MFWSALPGAIALGLIWGIMAIGVYITYKVLDFADLTVDGSICTGGAVCAVLMAAGVNAWLAILVAMLAGALAGLVTGIFHTLMGIPAILSGILTQLILWSVNLKIMGQANTAVDTRGQYVIISATSMENTAWSILILVGFIAVIVGLLYWFFGTEMGCGIRATGNNPNMSRAQGINVNLNKIIGLMLSNALVALAGALLVQYQGFADINMGRGAIVIGLAAVIIGEAIVTRISRNFAVQLLGVVLGGIIYYIVYQFVIWLNIDTEYLKMLAAIVVAIFLAVPYLKEKYFSKIKWKRRKKAGPAADGEGLAGGDGDGK